MFISDISKATKKGLLSYSIAAVILGLIGYVYTLHGHGVHSRAMSFMFMYPVFGGVIFLLFSRNLSADKRTELNGWIYSLLHMGVGTLAMGSFLKGVLEIAGTGSVFLGWIYNIGYILIFAVLMLELWSTRPVKS